MLKTISAVAAVLAASALVGSTTARAEAPASARVSYADLNLGGLEGQQVLSRRIAGAARQVCDYGRLQDISRMSAAGLCRDEAIARAQPAYQAAVNAARRGTVTVLDAAALIVTAQ